MSLRIRSVLLGVLFAAMVRTEAAPPVDCNCVSNLPALTVTCPATLPDLCAIATNCFGATMLPGSCIQNLPPGMPVPVGTYLLNLQVQDTSSNYFSCAVPFTVNPPVPAPNLIVTCPTNKTVECGSNWNFDPPVVLSSCCGVTMTPTDTVVSNSPCSQNITRNWLITDGCGNSKTCSQKVTTVDTTPPGTQCNGQNLVPNGDFERYTNCPSSISQFNFAAPWFTPTDATPDYYNSCSGVGSFVTTPTNSVGVQVPLSGQGYAGAFVYSKFGSNPTNSYREYLEVPLVTTLTPGQKYLVSFYVSRAEYFGQAVANIGARFMPLAYTMFGPPSNLYGGVLDFPTPPSVVNSPSNVITDSTNWTLIQGIYTAIGFESHLILGNFKDDPNTPATFVGGANTNYAYYYFDNVSVVAICDPGMTNKVVQCGEPWEIPPFPIIDNCSGGNITISNYTATNFYCPKVIQRDWYLADQCGNTNLLTQTVTIVDTNPPVLMCAGGANLVPNPSFESYAFCPWFFSQVPTAAPWFNPTVATPDYFNACTTFPLVSTPTNFPGSQTPLSGQGYVGAFVYSRYGTNPPPGYREYIEAPLLAPLVAGVTYQVSFRVNLADYSGWAISEIGAHFSSGPVVSNSSQSVMTVIPQVVNPSANLLTSTNSWMLVQGTFTATGGESYITLGNFRNDALTTAVLNLGTNSPSPSFVDFAYYYYDDIAVVPLCSFTNKTVPCGEAWSFDPPLAYDTCSGNSPTTTVLGTTTNGTCPKIITRIWNIADACGNSLNATQSVTIVDTTPPQVSCTGPNLVPNPSFENYTNCPWTASLLDYAAPWYKPTDGTADYYNTCATNGSTVTVPTNWIGVQAPFTGQAYAGAYVYSSGAFGPGFDYREYLQTPLLAPLVAGQTYTVSFHVSLAENSSYAIAELAAYFSVGPVTNTVGPGGTVMPVVPQVQNPSANLLASTNSWMLVQGTFTAAGGENYLTLGNFRFDTNTTAVAVGAPFSPYAYYYYDEISITTLCPPPNKVVACGAPWNFDTPSGFDQCSGTNVTVTVASTVTNSLCPLNATRSWWLSDLCGNSNLWTQSVTAATNGGSLTVNCGCLQDSNLALLTTNACQAVVPNLSVLSNSPCISNSCGAINIAQSPAAGTVVGAGSHNITVKISNCSGITNTCVLPFNVYAPLPAIACPTNIYVLTCTTSAVVNFSVNASGNAGPVVCSPPSGSAFAIGTNAVICTATSSCGGVAICGFYVIVRPASFKFGCYTKAVAIINTPIGTARMVHLPDFPGGGVGVDFDNLGSSGQDGVRFDLGAAQNFTFTTVLDFSAPEGARLDLVLPPIAGQLAGRTLMSFVRDCQPHCGWNIRRPMAAGEHPDDLYRSIAISDEGELFSSFTQDAAALGTNVLASITSMNGATSAVMRVTLDCLTSEVTLAFPECDWTPQNGRKGWDGCIYGNGTPSKGLKTNKTARLILTPLSTVPPPPITMMDLLASNLTTVPFRDPTIGATGRKWGDGHVTLMKAYDDGTESGMEFFSLGTGGGMQTDLGHAASFQFRMTSLDDTVPNQEQLFAFRGWPPGTTTNRPPPPVLNLRLAQSSGGFGIDCSADFTQWGVSNVTVQLWSNNVLVAETSHVPATLASSLATLSGFPGIIGCPGVGVLSLANTNPFVVYTGVDCVDPTGCIGTELRILAEMSTMSTPPTAFTGLECFISDRMDNLIYRLQTTPACLPVPLHVAASTVGVTLTWEGDGFHLQGAESVSGPWYDLEVESPATIPAGSTARVFRLRCE